MSSSIRPIARRTGASSFGRGPASERGLDELLDVAIEDALHVTDLDAGAVILHEGVRVQHVASDLAPPVRGPQLPALLGLLRLLLEDALLEQASAQHPHR